VRLFPRIAACVAGARLLGACGQLSGLSGFAEGSGTSDAGAADGKAKLPEDGAGAAALPDARTSGDATVGGDVADAGGDATGDEGAGDDATGPEDAPSGPDARDTAGEDAETGCNGAFIACPGGCVDPSSALHCGSCSNACGGGTPLCAASSGTYVCTSSGCPSAAPTFCGSSCVDEQTDVNNCNGCGNTCPGVANGQAACVSGACTFTCGSGYSPCAGACVPFTTTANCGACGNACTGGSQFCLPSGSSYSCGGTFGGIYSDVDTSACGAIAQTCNSGVYFGNPLDSNACGCPAGYSTSTAMNLMNDQAGGNCGNGIWGWGSVRVCYAGTNATLISADDFGGFYQTVASNCATPVPAQTCAVGNPFVSGGACSCPTGWKTITMKVDGTNWGQGTINFCWNSSAPLTTFGGAYEGTDPGTGYGGATSTAGGCLVGNPAVTGTTCNCPTGTSAVSVRSIYGTPQSGCGDSAQDGSHVFVCVK
jgi:hypothetical protein